MSTVSNEFSYLLSIDVDFSQLLKTISLSSFSFALSFSDENSKRLKGERQDEDKNDQLKMANAANQQTKMHLEFNEGPMYCEMKQKDSTVIELVQCIFVKKQIVSREKDFIKYASCDKSRNQSSFGKPCRTMKK